MSTQVTAAQALADLQAAETATQAQITALTTAVNNGIATLESLLANQGVTPAAVEAVVAQMKTDAANLGTLTASVVSEEAKAGS